MKEMVYTQLHDEVACLFADNMGGVGGMAGGIAGGIGASVGGVMSLARGQFERRFTDVSYDLLISKTFYFFFYAAFGSVDLGCQSNAVTVGLYHRCVTPKMYAPLRSELVVK